MLKPTLKEALKFWIKLGFISFGGPAGQIAIMHEYLVDKKKWISNSKFLHALNYCMILPGPEAQQLATYIGWLLHGKRGGLAAGIFFVLPSMFILFGLSWMYVSFGNLPWVYSMFDGLKPAVIAIVILALIKISKKSLSTRFHVFIAIAAFICIYFFKISFPIIILSAIFLAIIIKKYFPSFILPSKDAEESKDQEEGYLLNSNNSEFKLDFSIVDLLKNILSAVVFWIAPIVIIYLVTTDFSFWKVLILFFTKAALVTFGGAYAVLPYVAQVSVEKFHWLTNLQMIDGLGLGETTPGPLIMVLAFVGFMAAHNHYDGSIIFGALGLIVTTYYTFLPCFLFIFAGAPIIEKTQENKKIKEILTIVTAAVVGVVLNLTIYLGQAVVFPKEFSLTGIDIKAIVWIVISFVAMYRYKINMIKWIVVSTAFGLTTYLISTLLLSISNS